MSKSKPPAVEETDVDTLDLAPDDGWNALYVDGEWVPAGDRDGIDVAFGGVGASGVGRYNDEHVLRKLTTLKWISIQREPREYPY